MNLANTIRMMAEKKDEPPFDVSKADYAGAAKELTKYAMTKGGMDKNDFLAFANRMSAIAGKKAPRVTAKFARDLMDLDTSPREKIVSVMRNNGIKVTAQGNTFRIEEHTPEEWDELAEAMVRGKEVFDKTFANRTQADNFAKKNGGRVKQVGRVFYVFKEAPEDDEPASPDEGSMALQQLEFIEYAADKLSDHIEDGGDFPEWMQNKLATVNDQMQSLYSQIDQDGSDQMDEAVNMAKVRSTYNDIMKGGRRGPPDDDEVGDYIGKGMTKADIAALIKMLAKQGYDAKFLTKDLAPLAEAKTKEQQIADLEKMLDRISGNTSAVKMKKFALQKKIDKLKNEELEEAYKTPSEAKAYEDGKKAVAKKVSYDDNPNKKGTKEYTAWSKGHNDARAKMIGNRFAKEEVELEESPMVSFTVPNVTSDMASKLERLAKENDVEYSRKGRTVVLKGKRIDVTSIRTKMGIAQTNIPMTPVKEEVELNEARDPSKSGGTGYDLYHKDFSSAMKHAYDYAKKKFGIEIDPQEIDDKVASGPRKPSSGKTNTYRLKGKDGKKAVQIQVSNLDNKKYELNMYKESVEMELDEAREDTPKQVAREILKMGVRQSAPEGEILKRIPFALKKLGLQNDKLIKRDPDFQGDVIDEFRGLKEKAEVNLDELFESAFEEELTEAKYQVTVKGAGRETVMARTEKEAIDKATRKMGVRTHGKKNEIEVKMIEESETDRHGNTRSFLDAIMNVVSEKKELDPVNKKALKKDFDDRKDKDLDNDGDTDDSDEYLHKKRQAVSKAIEKEVSDKEDEPKGKVGKSNKQTKVDVNPSIEEEKGEEMTSAEMEKRDEIMKSLEKKKDEFVKKYGDRAKEVMARTAIKMAKKHA